MSNTNTVSLKSISVKIVMNVTNWTPSSLSLAGAGAAASAAAGLAAGGFRLGTFFGGGDSSAVACSLFASRSRRRFNFARLAMKSAPLFAVVGGTVEENEINECLF